MRLPDGRILGYAVTGDVDGPPVFYCHGWPASRLEAGLIDDPPLRLIAVDRPGYGLSSPQSGRRIMDAAADVAALADYLGIAVFSVIGVSGGAPYALACAAILSRVTEVILVSPVPPLSRRHGPRDSTLGQSLLALRRIGEQGRLGWAVMAGIRLGIGAGLLDPQGAIDRAASPRDAAALSPDLRTRLIGTWREGMRHGVAGAMADARIYVSDWGFDMESITQPVTILHGTDDRGEPVATLEAYDTLRATRRLVEGEGHYSLALTRSAEMMAAL